MNIEKIKKIFDDEGFRPNIDEDGDLVFKFEGRTYFLDTPTDDDYYVRVVLPNFWGGNRDAPRIIAVNT